MSVSQDLFKRFGLILRWINLSNVIIITILVIDDLNKNNYYRLTIKYLSTKRFHGFRISCLLGIRKQDIRYVFLFHWIFYNTPDTRINLCLFEHKYKENAYVFFVRISYLGLL